MITAVLYVWFMAHGQLPVEPWWIAGLLFMDACVWSELTPLFNEVEV